ncbi:MAG TPA: copper chaperone PCu(A)C [Anaerolineaceae bacterium]|nr:copper chaperone PCu(A)C [Anaerolineaceae bacterium]
MKKLILLAVLVFVLAGCAGAQAKLSVSEVWARPASSGDTSAIYFIIDNPTTEADALVKAETDVAMMAELHLSKMDTSGAMIMEQQQSIAVAAGGKTELKPGSYHVMLMKLKKDLAVGDTFEVTLTFEKAGAQKYTVTVKQP